MSSSVSRPFAAFLVLLLGANIAHAAGELRITNCIVSVIEDVTFAAQEDGLLREILVHEGSVVKPKSLVAKLDDSKALVDRGIAEMQYQVAKTKADNDVDARLARAEHKVKTFEHEQAIEANKVVSKVVGQVELKRMTLAIEEASLKAEKAERDRAALVQEKSVRELEVEAAKLGVERRTVSSTLDGVVVQRFVDVGEWVKVGDPICRAIRLDRVWVEGLIEARTHTAGQMIGKNVDVQVELLGGKMETFQGKVVFVDPQIDGNGRFRVRAEVTNRERDGAWLMLPGQLAEMVVALPAAAAATPAASTTAPPTSSTSSTPPPRKE
jgi:multidrug efflux pump subunit AcrA (membrane-fusion protein)